MSKEFISFALETGNITIPREDVVEVQWVDSDTEDVPEGVYVTIVDRFAKQTTYKAAEGYIEIVRQLHQ